ncbi:MAG: hypothetical protein WA949_23745 [Phormidesmis sp.]
MTPEQLAEIQRLRDHKVAPKQIARKLGLRPAEVKLAIQQQATIQQQESLAKGELPPIEACFANRSMVSALLADKDPEFAGSAGLGIVMVVRQQRNGFAAATFLVDYYCLGIKNASSKKLSNANKYLQMKEFAFSRFEESVEEIPLRQAQAIVWGAVDYARQLGFEPHKDFEAAKDILAGDIETLPVLNFGKDGKPLYVNGPYDNAEKVLKTLEKSVGKGNYDCLLQGGPEEIGILKGNSGSFFLR